MDWAQKIAFSPLQKMLNSMVCGRYSELVFMGVINQSSITGKHHPVVVVRNAFIMVRNGAPPMMFVVL